MKLNKSSNYIKLMTWMYDHNLPKNLCGLFWKSIFLVFWLIILFPFGLMLYVGSGKDLEDRGIATFMNGLLLLSIYALTRTTEDLFENVFGLNLIIKDDISTWWKAIFPLITGVAIIAAAVVIIYFIVKLFKSISLFKREKEAREPRPNVVVEFFKAKKNKVCPLIEYTDE
jgi:hypothetical protein